MYFKLVYLKIAAIIILTVNCLIANNIDTPTTTIADIEELAKSPNWLDRNTAAKQLIHISFEDTSKVVELIVKGIKREISNPSSDSMQTSTFLSDSERILMTYFDNLVKLGKPINKLLLSLNDSLKGDEIFWIKLALGYLKEETVHDEIKNILLNNPNPTLRIAAVRSLAQYNDSADTEVYILALSDPYQVTYRSDHGDVKEGEYYQVLSIYPIRSYSVSELAKRGIIVEQDSNGNYIVKDK